MIKLRQRPGLFHSGQQQNVGSDAMEEGSVKV